MKTIIKQIYGILLLYLILQPIPGFAELDTNAILYSKNDSINVNLNGFFDDTLIYPEKTSYSFGAIIYGFEYCSKWSDVKVDLKKISERIKSISAPDYNNFFIGYKINRKRAIGTCRGTKWNVPLSDTETFERVVKLYFEKLAQQPSSEPTEIIDDEKVNIQISESLNLGQSTKKPITKPYQGPPLFKSHISDKGHMNYNSYREWHYLEHLENFNVNGSFIMGIWMKHHAFCSKWADTNKDQFDISKEISKLSISDAELFKNGWNKINNFGSCKDFKTDQKQGIQNYLSNLENLVRKELGLIEEVQQPVFID